MYGQIAHTINSVFVTVCVFSGNFQPNQFHSLTSWYREHRINVTIPKLIYIEKVCWSVENLHSLHLMFELLYVPHPKSNLTIPFLSIQSFRFHSFQLTMVCVIILLYFHTQICFVLFICTLLSMMPSIFEYT